MYLGVGLANKTFLDTMTFICVSIPHQQNEHIPVTLTSSIHSYTEILDKNHVVKLTSKEMSFLSKPTVNNERVKAYRLNRQNMYVWLTLE